MGTPATTVGSEAPFYNHSQAEGNELRKKDSTGTALLPWNNSMSTKIMTLAVFGEDESGCLLNIR